LLLREDNADLRLTPHGRALGLVDEERWRLFEQKHAASEAEVERLQRLRLRPQELSEEWSRRVLGAPLSREQTAFELLCRPQVSYAQLLEVAGAPAWAQLDERLPAQIERQVEVRARYAGYITRQQEEIERQQRNEDTPLPLDLEYAQVPGLSMEVRQRLAEARPVSVGQAARVPGVTPAAVSILLVYLKKRGSGTRERVA